MPGAFGLLDDNHVVEAQARGKHQERTRHALAAAKARGIKLGNPEQAKINRAEATARAQALRPHIERCIKVSVMYSAT